MRWLKLDARRWRARLRRHRLFLALALASAVALAGIVASVAAGGPAQHARRGRGAAAGYLARSHGAGAQAAARAARRAERAGQGVQPWRGDVPAAAGYLGIDARLVRRRLRAGSSLAEIAAATPGRSRSGLIDALVAARERRLAATAAAGLVTRRAERRLTAALPARVAREVARKGGPDAGTALRRRAGALSPAARYLGLTTGALRHQVQSGRSLAQIAAGTPGRSLAGLVAALVTAAKARLGGAVAAGRLSPQAEARLLARLPARVTTRVSRVRRPHAARR